jgi:hypothetical protein
MDQIIAANDRMNIFEIRELNLQRFAADGMYTDQVIRILELHSKEQLQRVHRNIRKNGEDTTVGLVPVHKPEFALRGPFPRRQLKTFDDSHYIQSANLPQIGPTPLDQLLEPFYREAYDTNILAEHDQYAYRLAKEVKIPVPLHQDSPNGLGYTMHTLRCTGLNEYRKSAPRNDSFWLTINNRDATWAGKHVEGLVLCRLLALIKIWKIPEGKPRVHAIIREYNLQKGLTGHEAHGLSRWMYNEGSQPWVTTLGAIYGGAYCVSDGTVSRNMFHANAHIDVSTWNMLQQDVPEEGS